MSLHLRRTGRVSSILVLLGLYLLLIALQMLVVFVISNHSIENDVFGGNLFVGIGFLTSGVVLAIVGIGLARPTSLWHLLPLAIGGAALFGFYYWLFGNRYYGFHETVSALPPYLGAQEFILSLGLGLAVGVFGWVLSGRWEPECR